MYMVSILLILWPTTFIKAQAYFRSRPFLMSEISIGALSHRTGLPVSTIRFYDDNGLIQSNRNGGGHRRFERAQIRRVSFIIAAQKFVYCAPDKRAAGFFTKRTHPNCRRLGATVGKVSGKFGWENREITKTAWHAIGLHWLRVFIIEKLRAL